MIFPLFRQPRAPDTIGALYGAIVAQARRVKFYAEYGVPDTIDGRFEMIVLHVALLIRRLGAERDAARRIGQGVFDRFCKDMDHNLRELGVSDTALAKRMRSMGEAFYGRAAAYERALAAPHEDYLIAAIARNILREGTPPAAARLAAYVRTAARDLATQDWHRLVEGHVRFPDPAGLLECP